MRLLTMKRGGAGGMVAINVDLVTQVRSSNGPFTDIYFGSDFVTVEGSFPQIVAQLAAAARPAPTGVTKWGPMGPAAGRSAAG